MKKRLFSLFLTLVMIAGVLPGFSLSVSADGTPEATWGTDAGSLTQTGTFDDAITAANATDSTVGYIQLQNDVVPPFDKTIFFYKSTTALTFDFNGHTVYGCMEGTSSTVFDIYRDITLRDTSDNPGGIHASTGSPFSAKERLTVEGGVYEGSFCSFAENGPYEGIPGKTTEITGGTFRTSDGSAFQATSDTLTVSGGTFQSDGGPALYAYDVGTLAVSGGTFRSTGAYTVECAQVGEVTVSGGTIHRGGFSAIRIDDSVDKKAVFTLSGTVSILNTLPNSDSDIALSYVYPDSTVDMSGWKGAALKVTTDNTIPASNFKVLDGWGIFDIYGAPASTLLCTELYTVKQSTVVSYDNSVSGWQYVLMVCRIDGDLDYTEGKQGENSVYFFTVPDGVNDIYFTNCLPGMPPEFYPEGVQRTVNFTVERSRPGQRRGFLRVVA